MLPELNSDHEFSFKDYVQDMQQEQNRFLKIF